MSGIGDFGEPLAAGGCHCRVAGKTVFEALAQQDLCACVERSQALPVGRVGEVRHLDGSFERLERVIAGVVDLVDDLPGGREFFQSRC